MEIPEVGWGSKVKVPSVGGWGGGYEDIFWTTHLEILVFQEKGKPEYPERNLSE